MTPPAKVVCKKFEGRLQEVVKVVCKTCNETWMSDIEAPNQTSFSQIIRSALPSRSYSALCPFWRAFAFEKAVIADHLHLKRDPFFNLPTEIVFGSSLAIPAGVQIWLAEFRGQSALQAFL